MSWSTPTGRKCHSTAQIRKWLTEVIEGESTFGVPELAMSSLVRIVTRGKPFDPPTPTAMALDFCGQIIDSPRCLTIRPSERHWQVFDGCAAGSRARGNLVPDAYFAAMAIDLGCEWITTDGDYAFFPGLTWRHPLEPQARTNPT